jgi:TrmH family RNA methyltransferase
MRSLRQRKAREASGLYLVEGIRLVAEAVQVGAPVEQIVVAPTLLTSPFAYQIVAQAEQRGTPVLTLDRQAFERIAEKEHPQGLAALLRQEWTALEQVRLNRTLCWIVLCGVRDPGNLGSILRTGDAVGSGGVILTGHTTDPYDPEAVRASMGAIFTQKLVRATLDDLARWKQARGYWAAGTSDSAAADYHAVAYRFPLLLVMGSEQHGLGPAEQALCDLVVRIPMVGRSDSLNLSVATGVVLYELFNQQRAAAGASP